jgi:CheY-like chemotaxis protein
MVALRVLSLGQCSADHYAISQLLLEGFGAEAIAADTVDEALSELRSGRYALVLVNRIFEYGGSGLAFIAELKSDESLGRLPVMLVSDRPEAQRQAVEHGALPGFGKAALRDPLTLQRLGAALKGSPLEAGTTPDE